MVDDPVETIIPERRRLPERSQKVSFQIEHDRGSVAKRNARGHPGSRKHQRWLSHQLIIGNLRKVMYESGEDVTDTDSDGVEHQRQPTTWTLLAQHQDILQLFLEVRDEEL